MKKTPRDRDPFDIKKNKNKYNAQRKNELLENKTDYSQGERSPYWEWRNNIGGYDPIDSDNLTSNASPWGIIPMSESVEVQWEALQAIYPLLKGRQKEVADLLLHGQTNQTLIAVQLGIDQRNMTKIFASIAKKISKKCM